MPVTGSPTTPLIVTVDNLRIFLRDKAENNILLDGVQFTQDDVNQAIEFAVDGFNTITPISSYTASNMPSRYILLLGTAKYLMQSEAFIQIRNQATFQDGDIQSVGVSDKMTAYLQLVQSIKAEYDELSRSLKTQLNLENAYGTLSSGYLNVSRSSHS